MAVICALIWAIINCAVLFGAIKVYLPKFKMDNRDMVMIEPEAGGNLIETKAFNGKCSKRDICILCIAMLLAAVCGYVSGSRQDYWLSMGKMLVMLSVLSVVAITDIDYYKIPNVWVAVVFLVRCISLIIEMFTVGNVILGVINSVIAGVSGFLFLLIISKITHGGIGYGDVKLFSALGFLCGVNAIVYTLIISFFLCAIVSILLLISKKKNVKDGIPLGPFVWIAFAATIILGLC